MGQGCTSEHLFKPSTHFSNTSSSPIAIKMARTGSFLAFSVRKKPPWGPLTELTNILSLVSDCNILAVKDGGESMAFAISPIY